MSSPAVDGARTVFGAIFRYLTMPLVIFGRFVGDWWSTRNWMWFLTSIPALLVGSLVIVGLVRARFSSDAALSNTYAKRARDAVKAEDFPRAEMMYRKAIKYRPGDPSLVYDRALVLDKLDRTQDAFRLMQTVAPLGEGVDAGFPSAHLWIAQSLMVKHIEVEGEYLPLVESHLNAVLDEEPANVHAHRLLTDLALAMGNGTVALEHIAQIVGRYPDTRIIYARLLDGANRKKDARTEAARCYDYYQRVIPDKLASETPPSAQDWLNWASSAMLLDRFKDATNILVRANNECEEKKLIRQGIAGVLVRWTQRLDEVDTPNIRQQLQLLGEAMRVAPDNPAVLERIALLIGRDTDSDPVAEEMLKKSLVDGTAPAIVHFLLGTRAAAEGDNLEEAISHLKQADKLNPNTPVILNNLAWIMASQKKGDLSKALDMANQAVKLKQFQPNFRDTRGQIHFRLGNWEDAIADLEMALGKLPNNVKIRESLAASYEKVGNVELAGMHRERLKQLKAAEKSGTNN